MEERPPRTTPLGTFVFRRYDELQTFRCAGCRPERSEKTSKIVVELTKTDGSKWKLCNGCYGAAVR